MDYLADFRKYFLWLRKRFHVYKAVGGLVLVFAASLIFFEFVLSAPTAFVTSAIFTIEKGMTLEQVARALAAEGYIRSETVFKLIVKGILLKDTGAVAGDYAFEKKLSVISVARRITSGDFHLEPLKITIPEGLNKFETAELLAKNLPQFNKAKFLAIAPEGYLFPDTYYFVPQTTPEKVVDSMKANFDRRISPLLPEIEKFIAEKTIGQKKDKEISLADVINMASIIETEARKQETREIIAGILWKRLEIGMPLQVDVSFQYVNGKGTFELTADDLKTDSLYNTYKYAGLPPTPISNPGLDSIKAAISPIKTPYFYFLSDKAGTMHYAATFEEHKKNRLLYLR